MQKIIIALAIALCVSTVVADFPGSTFLVAPVQVIQDNETSYTNTSGAGLVLANTNTNELSIVSQSVNPNATALNQYNWQIWRKVVANNKALNSLSSLTASNTTFVAPRYIGYSNGYVIAIVTEQDATSNLSTLRVYQNALSGGAALAKITLSTAAVNNTIQLLGAGIIKNVVYPFYWVANGTIKYTSFTVGSTANATENQLTTAADAYSLQATWGESLKSTVLAYWTEGGVAKDAVVDVVKGAATPAAVAGVTTNHTCRPFATDSKLYGELCSLSSAANFSISTYVAIKSNGSALTTTPLAVYNANVTSIASVDPYAGYLIVWLTNASAPGVPVTLSYEIWNLDTSSLFKTRTTYLTYDPTKVGFQPLRMPAGNVFGLLYNAGQNNLTYSTVSVGVILAGSYLTTILGFVMTIVAGLFLF